MSAMETETMTAPAETAPVAPAEEKSNLHNATGDFGVSTSTEQEQFVGFQLNKEEKEFIWDPEVTPVKTSMLSNSSILQVNQYSRLLVKQAILSPDAADGELNCVEVEGSFPRSLNKMPLAVLSGGRDMQRYLDVYFPEPPLTFRLTHGNGPVFILAQSMIENSADDSDDELDTADDETGADTADSAVEEEPAAEEEAVDEAVDEAVEEEEEAEAEESPVKTKKRKAGKSPATITKGKSKKSKMEPEVEDEEEEVDEEESEEEAEPSPPPKKKSKAAAKPAKAKGKGKPAKVDTEEEEESEEEPPKKKGRAAAKKAKGKAGKKGRK